MYLLHQYEFSVIQMYHMNSYMSSCDTFVFTTQYEFMWYIWLLILSMWYICIYYSIWVHVNTNVFTWTQYEFIWYICIYYSIWVHVIHLYLLLNMSSCITCIYYSIWVHVIHLYHMNSYWVVNNKCDHMYLLTQYEFMWYKCIYYSIWTHIE